MFFFKISERQAKLAEELERQRLEEMDEEEYDALSEQEKARVDEKRLIIKKQRIKRLAYFSYEDLVSILFVKEWQ